jgi:hypothetical protein
MVHPGFKPTRTELMDKIDDNARYSIGKMKGRDKRGLIGIQEEDDRIRL